MEKNSGSLFDMLLRGQRIFRNREYLRPSYTPEELPHRREQIHNLARIWAAPLRGETPSNVFIYGKPGTGKTATVKHVMKELEKVGGRAPKKIEVIYLNCEEIRTKYRILATLANVLLERRSEEGRGNGKGLPEQVPMTGWPTDQVYRYFFEAVDAVEQVLIIVLDEIDRLVMRSGDEVLYTLTRMNSDLTNSKVSIVGISNNLNFMDYLDPRVRSSLSEEELVFPPYNALQLGDILRKRAEMSFEEGVLDPGVIPLCAAHAAREHGDARRALDLLRTAGELAEIEGAEKVTTTHVSRAFEKIERDKMLEVIHTLPTQSKLVLYSIVLLNEHRVPRIVTGDVYNVYCALCRRNGQDILTKRRVSDLISELDMLGIVNARITNKGRYGRTKEIELNVQPIQVKAAILDDMEIGDPDPASIPRQLKLV
ncbi:MAG: ORC1-type DNA replication protein [Hadesarchaea archaeon]|nr:ORC1-type DNA replication protein [Hadesarchaea archaeon]